MYQTLDDLPEHVRMTMSKEAQQTYLEAFQRSWRQYEQYTGGDAGQHAVAHRDAMQAVDHHFEKGMDGKYYPTGVVPEQTEDGLPAFFEHLAARSHQE